MPEELIHTSVGDQVAVLRLQGPAGSAVNIALLESLEQAIAWAGGLAEVQAVVLTGSAEHFSSGADLRIFRQIQGPHDARRVSRRFQEALQTIEDSPKPVAAAVAGHVLGCALELAMACHYRVCTDKSRLGSPEVQFGINPGAGATQRLPRLVGIEAALRMLLSGRPVSAEEALRLGLVDRLCASGELLDCALAAARRGLPLRATGRLAPQPAEELQQRAIFEQAASQLDEVHPELIAPREILAAVRIGVEQSFEAGLTAEQDAFARCIATPAAGNKIYLFFATRATGRVAEAEHAAVELPGCAAVVGLGTMGRGIARALAAAGLEVLAVERDSAALDTALEQLKQGMERSVRAGRVSQERAQALLARIRPVYDWQRLGEAGLAVEAVFEDARLKRQVIGQLEQVLGAGALIGSNTSTISLDVLAGEMQHPERLVGLHFFNPAHRMPLVEIIRRRGSTPAAVATAVALVRRLGKTPVVVNNREGFLVNRIFIPYLKEAFCLVEEGIEPEAVDQAMVEFGFPMGPLALADMAGLDILAQTDAVLRAAFPRHGPLSPIVGELVAAGYLGQKSAAGVYKYAPGDYTPLSHPAARQIIARCRAAKAGAGSVSAEADDIARRLVLRMACEAFWVLADGLVRRGCEIDAAMVLGTGFPDFRGGPLRFAAHLGKDRLLDELGRLATACSERFSPPPLLHSLKDLHDVLDTGT